MIFIVIINSYKGFVLPNIMSFWLLATGIWQFSAISQMPVASNKLFPKLYNQFNDTKQMNIQQRTLVKNNYFR